MLDANPGRTLAQRNEFSIFRTFGGNIFFGGEVFLFRLSAGPRSAVFCNALLPRLLDVRNKFILLTKGFVMSTLSAHILQAAAALPEGGVLSPKEFLHLGQRAAVDQNFTRLVRQGRLLRLCRGLYVLPVEGRFGRRAPQAEKVLQGLAQKSGELIVAHGAATANHLGLSTQLPLKEVFYTSGHNRTLALGKRTLTLQHAPSWLLLLGHRPGGALIRALAWLGEQQAQSFMPQLREKIAPEEWQAVAAVRFKLPSWLAKIFSQVTCHA